ncbi:MAG: TetR/AcrR family transcriptional regulator [Jiangellaceae bacterium]
MARAVSDPLGDQNLRERFVSAALIALNDHGPVELTVRRVAELAGSSTMGIYTQFGGRSGMLEAIYRRGFELLRSSLTAAFDDLADPAAHDPTERVVAISLAYRHFALDNPALYAFMFERPLPGFDPSPQLRAEALGMTFTLLTDEVHRAQADGLVAGDDPVRPAYLLWTAMHGMTSIELTHAARSPLPGWFLDSRDAGERVFVAGVRALLAGLGT